MSLKLKNIQVDANAVQKNISTNGSVGDRDVSVKAHVNANLKDDWTAKLTVTDKTASDLAKNVSANPAGARLEINKGDELRVGYNLEKSAVFAGVARPVTLSNRDVKLSAEYNQGEANEISLEASHDLDKNTNITLNYGVGNQELTARMRYRMDNSTIKPEVNVRTQAWKVALEHKLTDQDRLEATMAKDADPTLAYVRNQDGIEIRLDAPVRSDIAANARVRVQRTFDL